MQGEVSQDRASRDAITSLPIICTMAVKSEESTDGGCKEVEAGDASTPRQWQCDSEVK